MKKAIVVDMHYGSVSVPELEAMQEKLAAKGIALTLAHCKTEAEIIAAAKGHSIIIATGNPPITRLVMEQLPELLAVIRCGIGVNSVDLEAATELNKVILFMPGFCVGELAVHATALALSLNRNIGYYDRRIRQGQWPKAQFYMPRSPKDLVLGLYGFGGSAKELYKIWHFGFGSKVITCDPYVPEEVRSQYEVTFVDFDTMLKESDVLSVNAPLNDETYHIFSTEAFKKMKNDAMIINIARGGLIDQEALADALEQGEIRFAGLDVFEQEPLPADSRLLQRDDVALTCHSAFYGEESKARQLQWAYEMTDSALNEAVVPAGRVANRSVMNTFKEFKFV